MIQRTFQVAYDITQSAVYTAYIPGIYRLLGDYMFPTTTTYYQNQNHSMNDGLPSSPTTEEKVDAWLTCALGGSPQDL